LSLQVKNVSGWLSSWVTVRGHFLQKGRLLMDISEQFGSATTQDEVDPFLELTPELVQKRRSQGRIIFDRFIRNRAAGVGAVALLFLVLFCFVGPYIWTINPDTVNTLTASSTLANPTLAHPFGTDDVGRDTLARAIYGGRVSLLVGFTSMLVAIIFGIGIGSFAGYYGGIVDNILMRFTDVVLAVPLFLLLFVLSAAFTDGSPQKRDLLDCRLKLDVCCAPGARGVSGAERAGVRPGVTRDWGAQSPPDVPPYPA
jgi:peptide/nickel transport system permease protein